MRALFTCAVLTVTVLTVDAAPVFAHSRYDALIDSWYHRYLRRHADATGLHDHARALRHGTPIEVVEASILASHEYYHRNGCTPEGFVAALYRDVLGRRASGHEFRRMVDCVLSHGRQAAAMRVLNERDLSVAPVVVASPAPPVVYTPPVVTRPVVVVPAHRPPVYASPTPSINIRLNFGR
jgi:hypothetical protein